MKTESYREIISGWILAGFHPGMVFSANLGVNLHVCLCGDLQVASAQTLDFLDIGQTGTRREAVGLSTRSVRRKILISGLETGFYREIISEWILAIEKARFFVKVKRGKGSKFV